MIRFAILGPGKISHRFTKGMKDVENAQITAVASRDLKKAQDYCALYGIEKAYGSYEEMLRDKEVDAVYIATPPFVHAVQIKMCLNAGKQVLCEKPLMKTSAEAKECFALAKEKGLMLMEATKGVFIPPFLKIKELVHNNALGPVSYVEASYCYDGNFNEDHWVKNQALAGGGMYDVGIYALSAVLCLLDKDVVDVKRLDFKGNNCLDFTQILLHFGDAVASVRGAISVNTQNKLLIYGKKGHIECEFFWKCHDFVVRVEGQEMNYHFEFDSEFTYEIAHFVQCIEKGLVESPVLSEKMSCLMLDIMDEKKTWM